jgi:hypothetical protein
MFFLMCHIDKSSVVLTIAWCLQQTEASVAIVIVEHRVQEKRGDSENDRDP